MVVNPPERFAPATITSLKRGDFVGDCRGPRIFFGICALSFVVHVVMRKEIFSASSEGEMEAHQSVVEKVFVLATPAI